MKLPAHSRPLNSTHPGHAVVDVFPLGEGIDLGDIDLADGHQRGSETLLLGLFHHQPALEPITVSGQELEVAQIVMVARIGLEGEAPLPAGPRTQQRRC